MPPVLFGPVIVAGVVLGLVDGAGWMTLVWVLCGYVFWTLTEYWLHRIVFTSSPITGSVRGCTSSSTGSTTITPTTRCGS